MDAGSGTGSAACPDVMVSVTDELAEVPFLNHILLVLVWVVFIGSMPLIGALNGFKKYRTKVSLTGVPVLLVYPEACVRLMWFCGVVDDPPLFKSAMVKITVSVYPGALTIFSVK